MRLTWLGHACFLIESEGLRLLTDPYDPELLGLPAITERADIVIRSSADDMAHAWTAGLRGKPVIITATEPQPPGEIKLRTIPSQERRDQPQARDNAMYRFTLEGMEIAHFGDVGNPLTPAQLDQLAGIDVALVPAGGPPTIPLADLHRALAVLRPRLVIPMHYRIPGAKPRMLPVTDFTGLYSPDVVRFAPEPSCELSLGSLPSGPRLLVLQSPPAPATSRSQ